MLNEAGHVLKDVAAYYGRRIEKFGATPLGVDWTCLPTQELRFVQLLRICDFSGPMSLNDLGCGYGALLAYLAKRHSDTFVDYLGIDISESMVARARQLWKRRASTAFVAGPAISRTADYGIASGIFNVKLMHSASLWEAHIRSTLAQLHSKSLRGFAVNFLVTAAAESPQELYRTSASQWVRFCEDELGGRVEVLRDYGMREFTLLVRPSGRPKAVG